MSAEGIKKKQGAKWITFPSLMEENKNSNLARIGRCRIHPNGNTFESIVELNRQQALMAAKQTDTDEERNETKKLKKKYMKQGNAMAQKFLIDEMGLDVSILNVEVFLDVQHVLDTQGFLATCFLDVGCQWIVLSLNQSSSWDALDSLFHQQLLPKERLIAHFTTTTTSISNDEYDSLVLNMEKALEYVNSISIQVPPIDDNDELLQSMERLLDFPVPELVFHTKAPTTSTPLSFLSSWKLKKFLAPPSLSSHQLIVRGLAFVDPTPQQLGLTYADLCVRSDRIDGLYTTVVATRGGEALGLVYSSKESIVAALECGRGVYYSRSRKGLWRKGDTSGHIQTLHRIDVDCDGDALLFTVTQQCPSNNNNHDHDHDHDDLSLPAFCHLNTLTCWGPGRGIRHLQETLQRRLHDAPAGSYTSRLFNDADLLRNKLVEEAQELSEATTPDDVAAELADVLYFSMVRAVQAGVSIDDAISILDARSNKVTRRPGNAKAFRIAAGEEILLSKKKDEEKEKKGEE